MAPYVVPAGLADDVSTAARRRRLVHAALGGSLDRVEALLEPGP
jgi:hypothetical protein